MKKNNIISSASLVGLSIIYTLLVRFYDYRAVGPNDSFVGFANLNGAFHRLTKVHMTLDSITDYLGLIILALVVFYAGVGLIQLIKRKSLKKVDKEIILLGAFYAIVALIFVLFEMIELNYRPILVDGQLDASFPSTHVFLSLFIGCSAILVNKKLFKKPLIINIVIALVTVTIIALRTISGVHWLTDIVGALLYASTLGYIYYSLISYKTKK